MGTQKQQGSTSYSPEGRGSKIKVSCALSGKGFQGAGGLLVMP